MGLRGRLRGKLRRRLRGRLRGKLRRRLRGELRRRLRRWAKLRKFNLSKVSNFISCTAIRPTHQTYYRITFLLWNNMVISTFTPSISILERIVAVATITSSHDQIHTIIGINLFL